MGLGDSNLFLSSFASSLRSSSFPRSSSCDSQVILPEEVGVITHLKLLKLPSFVFLPLRFKFLLPPNLVLFPLAFEFSVALLSLRWVRAW